ncbi:MAG: phosphomannomutase/phosphoglucomutase, partial [Nitrospinota bacterium]|nr:phosphomannomutase/phosphoglucomutase [Nitrospinota bacterium]
MDIFPAYLERATMGRNLDRPVKIVLDAGNGVAGPAASRVLRAIGTEVVELFCEPDASFPNHHPDPTIPENLEALIATVAETGAEAGIALDGDGDRIGAVDATGRIIWGDELLILFSKEILSRRRGEPVVFDVKCSSRLAKAVEDMGGRPVMSATGHSLIRARLLKEKAPLAGELSGHIFFEDDYLGYDDAIYAAVRLVHLLSRENRTLADLMADLPPSIATPELRIDCNDEKKFQIVEELKAHFRKIYETVEVDGVRVNFPKGWGLVRASNTQPVLVCRIEAEDEASLAAYRREI